MAEGRCVQKQRWHFQRLIWLDLGEGMHSPYRPCRIGVLSPSMLHRGSNNLPGTALWQPGPREGKLVTQNPLDIMTPGNVHGTPYDDGYMHL